MVSAVGWLDASAADERRMREIVQLFSQRESRDELGIGQIRDMLSNLLFPGISVIQTRGRYFLMVPWLIAEAVSHSRAGGRIIDTVEQLERRQIRHVLDERSASDHDGLIGRIAGHRVKILPSTIYWSGLQTFGIVPENVERTDLDRLMRACHTPAAARRLLADLPEPPEAFPKVLGGGFDLTRIESTWLRDRIVTSTEQPTLLSHLATSNAPSERTPGRAHAWDEPVVDDAPASVRNALHHAELFSLMIEGAALLYNRLLADHAETLGFGTEHGDRLDDRLDAWCAGVRNDGGRLRGWNLDDLWALDPARSARLNPFTRLFVREWVDLVCTADDPARAVSSAAARDLITMREMRQKGGQSRFRNERLLRTWEGEAGTGRLDFRWPVAHRILTDLHEGFGRVPA